MLEHFIHIFIFTFLIHCHFSQLVIHQKIKPPNNIISLIDTYNNETKNDPFIYPGYIDSEDGIVIPEESMKTIAKFMKVFFIIVIILAIPTGIWFGIRYYRRKKLSNTSYYYEQTNQLFTDNFQI